MAEPLIALLFRSRQRLLVADKPQGTWKKRKNRLLDF
jgi:hypothetical protein